jgi:hypothetical protein
VLSAFSALLTTAFAPFCFTLMSLPPFGPTPSPLPLFLLTFAHVVLDGTTRLIISFLVLLPPMMVYVSSDVVAILVPSPPPHINSLHVPSRASSWVTRLTPKATVAMILCHTRCSHPGTFTLMSTTFRLHRNRWRPPFTRRRLSISSSACPGRYAWALRRDALELWRPLVTLELCLG